MACIGDALQDAVWDLDTPFVRMRSAHIFGPGAHYCAQLKSSEDTGLVISGHKVTSSGVFALLFGAIVTFRVLNSVRLGFRQVPQSEQKNKYGAFAGENRWC